MKAMRLLDRLWERDEISGDGRCPTYLIRWTIWQAKRKVLRTCGLYIHCFVADDWAGDMHDHSKRMITIGLKGCYLEEWLDPFTRTPMSRRYTAPWIRTFPASHIHRIRLVDGQPCWTFAVMLRASRTWGFWHKGQWIIWRDYMKSEIASAMKSCQ